MPNRKKELVKLEFKEVDTPTYYIWDYINKTSDEIEPIMTNYNKIISTKAKSYEKEILQSPVENLTVKDLQLILACEYRMSTMTMSQNKNIESNFWKQLSGATIISSMMVIGLFFAIYGAISSFFPSLIFGVFLFGLSNLGIFVISTQIDDNSTT